MSHFYGVIQGGRGQASRCGHKSTGMVATAASWSGAIEVCLFFDETTGKDRFKVRQRPWHGHGVERVIVEGIVGEDLVAKEVETVASDQFGSTERLASLGSVSTGTLRTEDLLRAFSDALADLRPIGSTAAGSETACLIERASRLADALDDGDVIGEDRGEAEIEAGEVVSELEDALQEHAPPFCYFGAHGGDGADFGFWISWDAVRDARQDGDLAEIADPGERDVLPESFGYALFSNCHGNASLYERQADGTWRTVWEVV